MKTVRIDNITIFAVEIFTKRKERKTVEEKSSEIYVYIYKYIFKLDILIHILSFKGSNDFFFYHTEFNHYALSSCWFRLQI